MSDITGNKKDENNSRSTDMQFIDKVNDFLQRFNWKRNNLAKACGISVATLSQFMSNKYPGDVGVMRLKIANVIEREENKLKNRSFKEKFIETSIVTRYFNVASLCHSCQEMGVIFSDAGFGKTMAGREYAKRKPDAIFIETVPACSPKIMFGLLRDKIGKGGNNTLYQMFDECVTKLKDSGRFLIIDEAENLAYKTLEYLRRLHDLADVGILFSGMPALIYNLCGTKGQYRQIYSRVGIAAELQPLQESDTETIVKRIIGDTDGLWKLLHDESKGNTRRLFKIIKLSIWIAMKKSRPLDKNVIEKAAEIVKVEEMV